MQMVKKSVIIFGAIWFILLVFMPKAEFYYSLEKELAKQDIRLNEESIDEGLFSLSIKDVTVHVKGVALAHIEELDFFTVLFYSTVEITGLQIDEALHAKVPASTKVLHGKQHLFSPLTMSFDANGSFGFVEGAVNFSDNAIYLEFLETKEIGMIQVYLQKNEKGWFYEKSF